MITALMTIWLLRLGFQALFSVLAMIVGLSLGLLSLVGPPLVILFGKAICWAWSPRSSACGKKPVSRSESLAN